MGKEILCLTKHPQKKIQSAASELRQHWKDLVIEETSAKKKTKNPSEAATVSTAVSSSSDPFPNGMESAKPKRESSEQNNGSKSTKENPLPLASTAPLIANSNKPAARVSPISKGSESMKPRRESSQQDMKENPPPPKLSAMIKCNDEARDKVREMVAEALVRVPGEVAAELRSEVAAADPIRVAVAVECHMFEKLGKSTGAQKARYRSILFNLRDAKNPDLRRRVLLGQVSPVALVGMAAEDMASDERKRQNQQIKDKAIFDCERAAPAKATTDQFKCGRCGKRKTTYYQLQTRSADEPMTTFVTCVECNNHWKFC